MSIGSTVGSQLVGSCLVMSCLVVATSHAAPNLNAVASGSVNASQIFGSIDANGRIILLNPNGFYIGS